MRFGCLWTRDRCSVPGRTPALRMFLLRYPAKIRPERCCLVSSRRVYGSFRYSNSVVSGLSSMSFSFILFLRLTLSKSNSFPRFATIIMRSRFCATPKSDEFNTFQLVLYPSSVSPCRIVDKVFPWSWWTRCLTFSRNTTLGCLAFIILNTE